MSSEENTSSTLENINKAAAIPPSRSDVISPKMMGWAMGLNTVCPIVLKVARSQSSRKNPGKVPKRIHKAEREKMKREHVNELFLALANALELTEETNGKASVLSEAARTVKDMLTQIESLRKENAALLFESQYVTTEKNELQDDTSFLEVEIAELQNVLKARAGESELDLNAAPPECQQHELTPGYMDDRFRFPAPQLAINQAQNVNSVYVIPICPDASIFPQSGNAELAPKPVKMVSKPQPRYPTPADTWPSQILEMHP